MVVKHLRDCKEFVAGDGTRLREVLHPERDPAEIGYSLAIARLGPGEASAPHRLRQGETHYVIRGTGRMHVGDQSVEVGAGDAVYVPAGAVQMLENPGADAIEFACIVEPAWRTEDEEILAGRSAAEKHQARSANRA